MFHIFKDIVGRCENLGRITNISMNEIYGSINVTIHGEKYLLTIMKEEKKNETV